jgi:hypothetical protein
LPEFQKLVITAKFSDEASKNAEALKSGLQKLGGAELPEHMERMRRHSVDLQKQVKTLVENIGEPVKAIPGFVKGLGLIGTAAVAVAFGIDRGIRALTESQVPYP